MGMVTSFTYKQSDSQWRSNNQFTLKDFYVVFINHDIFARSRLHESIERAGLRAQRGAGVKNHNLSTAAMMTPAPAGMRARR